jgi:3'-phosphoadenosine 5'-phosphosulfate sulfotransferase (PAPS reductase)/FAD synthetase
MLLKDKELFKKTYQKARMVMEKHYGDNVWISYSGGADSDTIMWLMRHLGYELPAFFSNTGIEYKATLEHIEYMREEGFYIKEVKPEHYIAYAQKEYGMPFINKIVSSMIARLQKNGFDFQRDGNKSLEQLLKEFPKTKSGVKWWTNEYDGYHFRIDWNKWLREFLLEYGMPYSVSDKCCTIVKKDVGKKFAKENNVDLVLMGMRKAEGGFRASGFDDCYKETNRVRGFPVYMPIYYWKDADRQLFDETYNIKHSRCYTEYGLSRTGCVACPFARKYKEELAIAEKYEPKLAKAVKHIFKDSYEWTEKYRNFYEEQNKKSKNWPLTN